MNKSHTSWEEQISDILPYQDKTQTKCMSIFMSSTWNGIV